MITSLLTHIIRATVFWSRKAALADWALKRRYKWISVMMADDQRYYLLMHTHGEAYAAFDRAFRVAYRESKDVEFASLTALGAYEAAKSGVACSPVNEKQTRPEGKEAIKALS